MLREHDEPRGVPRTSPPVELTDEHVAFISASPLVFLMSNAPSGIPDISPRGDAAGFVRMAGRDRLRIPDRIGNNRLDTMQNVLADRRITVVFLRKGDSQVLTVSGSATILSDPSLLEPFAIKGRAPRSVLEIEIESVATMQSPAFAQSAFWSASGERSGAIASLGEILADQVGGMTKEEGEAFIANSYQNKLY